MKIYRNIYNLITEPENLFIAWDRFKADKKNKRDVLEFEQNLEQNIFALHRELTNQTYKHGNYESFYVHDPKIRNIHKATVRDRILHHAVFRVLNNIFEPMFIPTSYSCRLGKGTHKAVAKLAEMLRRESRNNAHQCWALKCDIKKFFDSIDHEILLGLLKRKIKDEKVIWLLEEIIGSYFRKSTRERERESKSGAPIGNLTSQLFANIYMNKFDQYVKHELRAKNYLRYTDDFVIIFTDKPYLEELLSKMQVFLREKLRLEMHPQKVFFRTFHQGVDFLGYVVRPHHITVRTKTRRRMFRKLEERVAEYKDGILTEKQLFASLQSYLGVLSHADTHEIREELLNKFWGYFHAKRIAV